MKSIRLNATIRSMIMSAVEKQYRENNPRPVIVTHNFISDVVDAYFVKHLKLLQDKILESGIPIGHFKTSAYQTYVDLEGNTQNVQAQYGINENGAQIQKYNLQINADSTTLVDLRNTKDKTLVAAVKEFNSIRKLERPQRVAQSAWDLVTVNYMNQVKEIVNGVGSTKQLLEVWPEIEEFLPESLVNPSSLQLPSFNLANLNAGLGK